VVALFRVAIDRNTLQQKSFLYKTFHSVYKLTPICTCTSTGYWTRQAVTITIWTAILISDLRKGEIDRSTRESEAMRYVVKGWWTLLINLVNPWASSICNKMTFLVTLNLYQKVMTILCSQKHQNYLAFSLDMQVRSVMQNCAVRHEISQA